MINKKNKHSFEYLFYKYASDGIRTRASFFRGPTSQGHHTFPYLLITLTPVSEHLPTNTFSSQTLHTYQSRRPNLGLYA